MLLARDGTGDRERAQELLDAALATYRELDMAGDAARASALAQGIGTAASTPLRVPKKGRGGDAVE